MNREKNIEDIIEGFKVIRQYFRTSSSKVTNLHLTHSQWLVLAVIARGEMVTVNDVRTKLGVSSSAATQLANGLEEKGYIKRMPHATDGRASVLSLTPKTKKVFTALRNKKLEEFGKLFNIFSDKEFALYMQLHTKLVKSIS